MSVTCLAGALLLSIVGTAHADAPEFLLTDLGVRLDLPKGSWRMTRWSDWDFKGEGHDGALLAFAWATPIQVAITEPPDGWSSVFVGKIEELQGADPQVSRTRVETIGGRPVALVDASFGVGKTAVQGLLRGGSVEIAGRDFHVALIGPERLASLADGELRGIFARLEVRTPPTEVAWGAKVTATQVEATLPPDFRPPLPAEEDTVAALAEPLGVGDRKGCFTAIRPVAGGSPDLLVACSGPLELGVVDPYSFEAVDKVVRVKTFGAQAEVAPAEQVTLPDRTAFLYAPRDGLAVGVAPHEAGVLRLWALGSPGSDLAAAVRTTMMAATFSGPHPASFGQKVSYWVTYRPFSPMVLLPTVGVLGVLVAIGGLAVSLVRRRPALPG